ncbi:MAG: multiubiquitin domain-containing protein [Xanthobacteraceae bacterium]|nr:multiubiquitin domain-containing protein [Xanthobacteraceae bacterium]MBX3533466.1 multiubiquitin domain-containing protein [Xanthobacteraceae bacterium]MCW5676406.1 multiubiquitin domain-containing protein [Xanthobacteraceae bacterium]
MSIEGKAGHGQGGFATQIGNAKFEFKVATFDDRKITGGQVAEAAGAHPIENFVILAQLPSFEIETLRPQETADLTKVLRFFVIEGDGTDKFFVDGLSLEWPKKKLSGNHIKILVGKEDENVELFLELMNEPDKLIADDDHVQIGEPGVEKMKTQKTGVTIKVNAKPHKWEKPKISYAEVVGLSEYASQPNIPYTITFTKGPNKPQGDLVKGDSVHVRDGMDFHVSPTGES